MAAFWPAQRSRFLDEECFNNFKAALPQFEKLLSENLGGQDWLSGTDFPMMVDFHFYPFLERFILLENSPWQEVFDKLEIKETCPTIYAYVNRFRSGPMAEHCAKQEHYNRLLAYWDANPESKPMLSIDFIK